MKDFEKLYTVDQIAEMLSVTPRTVRTYLRLGTLKGHKIGGQWRFTEEDIQSMFEDSCIKKKIQDDSQQDVLDYLDGLHCKPAGEISVCSVVDVYLPKDKAAEKCERLYMLCAEEESEELSFRYDYNDDAGRGRFVIFGTPKLIEKVMTIIR